MSHQRRRFTLFLLSGIGAFFLLLLTFLPTLISTQGGTKVTLGIVNKIIPGHLSIEKMDLSWFSHQKIDNLRLLDKNGVEVLKFQSFSSQASLFTSLFGSRNVGLTTLDNFSLNLVQDEQGQVNLKEALSKKVSKKKKRSKRFNFEGEIHLKNGTITLHAPQIDSIQLTDFSLDLFSENSLFSVYGKTVQGPISGTISATGSFDQNLTTKIDITNFPIALLDGLQGTKIYALTLGDSIDIHAELSQNGEETTWVANFKSLNLQGNLKGTGKNRVFTFDPSSEIVYALNPIAFKEFTKANEWHLGEKAFITFKIQGLTLPQRFKGRSFLDIRFIGDIIIPRLELGHQNLGNFSLNNFVFHFEPGTKLEGSFSGDVQSKGGSSNLNGFASIDDDKKIFYKADFKNLSTHLLESITPQASLLTTYLGPTFNFASTGFYKNGSIDSEIAIESSLFALKGTLRGKTLADLTLQMDGGVNLPQKITPFLGEHAKLDLYSNLSFANERLTIPELDVSIKNEHLKIEAKGKIGDKNSENVAQNLHLLVSGIFTDFTIPSNRSDKEPPPLHDGAFFAEVDGSKNVIYSKLNLASSEKSHTLNANVKIENFVKDQTIDFKNARYLLQAKLHRYPIEIFSYFLKKHLPLETLFGNHIDLDLSAQYNPEEKTQLALVEVDVHGEGLQANFSVSMDHNLKILPSKPGVVHWEMTDARYRALLALFSKPLPLNYTLQKTAILGVTIREFICPSPPYTSLISFICHGGFVGECEVDPLLFVNHQTGDYFTIKNVKVSFQGKDIASEVFIDARGEVDAPYLPQNEKSGFLFNGEIHQLLTEAGEFNSEFFSVKGDCRLDLIPVRALCGILPLQEKTRHQSSALFGNFINAHTFGEIAHLSGPVTFDVKSSNFKALLPMQLNTGTLFLTKGVEAELTLTPEVNEIFLKDVVPFLITGAWSDHPLKLYIDASGFVLPLHPFDFARVNIDNAVLDLGKIGVRNGGQVQALTNFLKAKGVLPDGTMDAWFTPIYFSLHQGIASYKRFDMLLGGTAHLAMWGNIDLINDNVNMILGISSATLHERFNISGIASKDMFQVKMRGTTSHLELDWSAATTRIGILIARSAGGQIGNIIGGIIEHIVTSMGDEETPPPTTTPFPWENQSSHQSLLESALQKLGEALL